MKRFHYLMNGDVFLVIWVMWSAILHLWSCLKINDVVATSVKRRRHPPRRSNLPNTKFCLLDKEIASPPNSKSGGSQRHTKSDHWIFGRRNKNTTKRFTSFVLPSLPGFSKPGSLFLTTHFSKLSGRWGRKHHADNFMPGNSDFEVPITVHFQRG